MKSTLVKEKNGVLELKMNQIYQKIAWTLISSGVIGLNLIILIMKSTGINLMGLFIISVILIPVGGLLLLIKKRVVFDSHSQVIYLGATKMFCFKEIEAIGFFEEKHVYTVNNTRSEVTVYSLGLVYGSSEATKIEKEKPKNQKPLLSGKILKLIHNRNLLKVWNASEAIAKFINIPILDITNSKIQKRLPEELDLPLGRRLAKNNTKPEEPGPVPEKKGRKLIEIAESGDKLILSWKVSHNAFIIAFVVMALFFFCLGLIISTVISSSSAGPWIIILFSFFGLIFIGFIPLMRRGHGLHELIFDNESLSYKVPHHTRKERIISLKELEYFNIQNRQEAYQLLFLSDNQIINCPVPKEAARWIKSRIESFIYGKPEF